jgi:hypothetical protein
MDADQIKLLMEEPRDALLLRLATTGHDAFPRAPLQRGEEVYRALRKSLRDSICGDPRVSALRSEDGHTPELVAAVADIVASATIGIPPFTVAVLFVRDGLSRLCREAG